MRPKSARGVFVRTATVFANVEKRSMIAFREELCAVFLRTKARSVAALTAVIILLQRSVGIHQSRWLLAEDGQ